MKNIFVQVKTDSLVNETSSITDAESFSIWFWVAVIELLIIVILFLKLKYNRGDSKFRDISKDKMQNAKKTDVNMNSLMDSINGSKDLYKELSRVCHPDRFTNSDKQKNAEEIFQEISKNKRDFNKLSELKKRAIAELNINLK